MELDADALEDHLADVAELLERYGAVLDLAPAEDLALAETPSGALELQLRGFLPDGRRPAGSTVELREVWRPAEGRRYARSEYEYELLDRERGWRRAWHLHDADDFVRHFDVVVHEHCEQPIGAARCDHYAGLPVRDAFAAVELLVGAWVNPDHPSCDGLICLERP